MYVVEPADSFGEPRTVNRAEIRQCTQLGDESRPRKLWCVPTGSEAVDSSDSSRITKRTTSEVATTCSDTRLRDIV